MRASYVKRKQYLALLKEIRQKCKELNVTLVIYYRPLIWHR